MRMEWQMGGLGLELSRGTDARLRTTGKLLQESSVNSGGWALHLHLDCKSFPKKRERKNVTTSALPGFGEIHDNCINVPSLAAPALWGPIIVMPKQRPHG